MSADAIDAIARMMSESRRRGKFRGLWCSAMGPRRSARSLVRVNGIELFVDGGMAQI
jgi:hypothetical protein